MDYPKERIISVIRRSARLLVTSEGQYRRKDGQPAMPQTLEWMMAPRGISWQIKLSEARLQETTHKGDRDVKVAEYVERLDDATRRQLIDEALANIYGE
jgi:hypothetical protein